MFVVKFRKIFYLLSSVLVVGSIVAMFVYGLNLGIDFRGGSILEVNYPEGRPEKVVIEDSLKALSVHESVRETGQNGYIIRMKSLTEAERKTVINAISMDKKIEEKRFDSIGPLLGNEAARKSMVSIVLVILAIVFFIAFAFRQVSEPVSSWKYGLVAIVALMHDVIVPTGVFAILGHLYGYEIDTLFVTALLVILGFSVHDTIVVFDRVRENLKHSNSKRDFGEIVGSSISQTMVRSINTSLTTVLALIALYIFGAEATKHFSLALIIGIIAGTYSSVFLGSPLLVTLEKWQRNKRK